MFNMSTASEWKNGVVNRNFFILQELLKDGRINKILSVDFVPLFGPRPFGFRRLIGYYWRELVRSRFVDQPGTRVLRHNLFSRLTRTGDKLYQYSSITAFFSPNLFWAEINKLIAQHLGSQNMVVWSCNPLLSDCFKKIPGAFRVFDTVDNWCTHPVYRKWQKTLAYKYSQIGETAQRIFVVSKELLMFYKETNKVSWLPNGIDWNLWASVQSADIARAIPVAATPSAEVPTPIKKPIIGYVGTIQERFDFDLLRYLAQQNPWYSFLLIGPVWRSVQAEFDAKLKMLPNVYSLGRKSYKETAVLVRTFDVAIIAHRPSAFTDSNNPLKMYEYLAAGRKVISTPLAGTDMFPSYIVTALTQPEFNSKLRTMVNDTTDDSAQRMLAVKSHSWGERVDSMLNLMK